MTGSLPDDLGRPGVERAETHISWVFLIEGDAWKVKKPVDLGFLDFSTIERRRAACEAEIRLNRRLAPDVYRGIVPVTLDATGRHRLGGDGPVVDWAVHMRRLAETDRADVRLRAGRLDATDLERIAARIAAFHDAALADDETARHGTVEAVTRNVAENFEQTRPFLAEYVSATEAAHLEAWQRAFLSRHRGLFEARVGARQVRDGHGDLRLEHIYLEGDRVTVLDCIEFNDRFRCGDVCADVAFLAMDLAAHGRADFAERFLASYAREANDYDLYPLVDFYESYRAFVRGKVRGLFAATSSHEDAKAEARRAFALALASARRSLLPAMCVGVGGVIASGKSTVAEQLGAEMAAPVVDSDRTRKHLLGRRPTEPVREGAFAGGYDPRFTDEVYGEVLRRAGAVLASGRPVLIDASFRTRKMRASARELARDHGVPFVLVECRADLEVCRARLRRREKGPSVSDGRLEIFDDFVARWEAVDELSAAEHVVVDTGRPLPETTAALRARLPTWPPRLTG